MGSLADALVAAYQAPDQQPFLFQVGQRVRVRIGCLVDGQTLRHWSGAFARVTGRRSSSLHKEHWYVLEHLNTGDVDDFAESELDQRYTKATPT